MRNNLEEGRTMFLDNDRMLLNSFVSLIIEFGTKTLSRLIGKQSYKQCYFLSTCIEQYCHQNEKVLTQSYCHSQYDCTHSDWSNIYKVVDFHCWI